MKKLILIILLIISSLTIIQGQTTPSKVHFGFRVGAGLGKVASEKFISTVTNFDAQRLKYTTSFGLGIISEINLKDNFALQAELGYALRGSVGENTFGSSAAGMVVSEVTGTYNIIELPVLAKLKFNGLYLMAGPQMQYLLSANKLNIPASPNNFYLGDGSTIITDVSSFKIGVGGGIGYQFGKMFAEARGSWMPSKTINSSIYGNSLVLDSNISFGVNLGYFFK
jgi:hypothetical protein